MLRALVNRVRAYGTGSALTYSLGRFSGVRECYGRAIGGLQAAGGVPGLRAVNGESLFGRHDAEALACQMRRDSAVLGLQLPGHVVAELREFARSAPLRDGGNPRILQPDEICDGRRSDGSPVFVGDVVGTDLCSAALRVARDPLLIAVVSRYLHYRPVGVDVRMLRSFVVDAPVEERRRHQTVDYHFDVHGYNFVYANFYVSDVDAESGAHEMVLGSHCQKPLSWLLGSARRTDEEVGREYGAERIRLIEGPGGTGFIQDSSCYHRVRAPTKRERIMLHLRYY